MTDTITPATPATPDGPRFIRHLPVHHLGIAPINELARKFSHANNRQALTEERNLMSTTGTGLDAVKARARGVSAYVKRMLDRRQQLLRSKEWARVEKLITSDRLTNALTTVPELPDAQYFVNLSDALRKAEAFRRDLRLSDLAERRDELVANPEWADARERIRNGKHVDVLTEGIREHGGEGYVTLVEAAVKSGESAMAAHIRSHTTFGGGGHFVSASTARKRAAQLRAKQARSAAAHNPGARGQKGQKGSSKAA